MVNVKIKTDSILVQLQHHKHADKFPPNFEFKQGFCCMLHSPSKMESSSPKRKQKKTKRNAPRTTFFAAATHGADGHNLITLQFASSSSLSDADRRSSKKKPDRDAPSPFSA